jgi:hypothetical protein
MAPSSRAGPEAGITVACRTTTARSWRHTRAGAAGGGAAFVSAEGSEEDETLGETVAQEVNNNKERDRERMGALVSR